MQQLLLSILFCTGLVQAEQVTTTVNCFPTTETLRYLESEYKETPVFFGKTKDGYLVIMFNSKTGTFTTIEFNYDTACVLAGGRNGSLIDKKSKTSLGQNSL